MNIDSESVADNEIVFKNEAEMEVYNNLDHSEKLLLGHEEAVKQNFNKLSSPFADHYFGFKWCYCSICKRVKYINKFFDKELAISTCKHCTQPLSYDDNDF